MYSYINGLIDNNKDVRGEERYKPATKAGNEEKGFCMGTSRGKCFRKGAAPSYVM